MSNLAIVGSGPRAISVALLAKTRGHSFVLIDPDPLSSWIPPNIIDDLEMRSPSTFDLFTFLPEMSSYSLSTYMGLQVKADTQQEVEYDENKVRRDIFLKYLKFLFREVLKYGTFYKERVISIEGSSVHTNNRTINSDHVIFAAGACSNKDLPLWIRQMNLESKCRTLKEIVETAPQDQSITVVGSGQGAAELVELLSRSNFVYWITNKDMRVDQYPAPSWKVWGPKSALSPYYRRIESWQLKLEYLDRVKSWQPSLTPYIWEKLQSRKDKWKIVRAESTKDLEKAISESSIISPQVGLKPDAKLIPCPDLEVYPFLPSFPKLDYGFTTSNDRLHITGMLAIPYDGPRQASLISAGVTSKEILDRIENNG